MTDMNSDPSGTNSIRILQWNINGLKAHLPTLIFALAENSYDVVVLQETLLKTHINLTNYTGFHNFYQAGLNRGISILIRSDLMAKAISVQPHCRHEVEFQGVTISLLNNDYHIFNIYRPPWASAKLKIDHIFAIVNNSSSILCGDFNAHNPLWNNPTTNSVAKTCSTGNYLRTLLQEFSDVSLVNSSDTTHLCGGVLDLTFVSSPLLPLTKWSLHPFLASDHFAVTTTIQALRVPTLSPTLKWDLRRADWRLYKDLIEDWVAGWVPPDDLDQFDSAFVGAIHEAGTQAFPTTSPSFHSHRNHWFYNDRIRELRHRLLIMRKLLRKHPSPDLLTTFRAANTLIRQSRKLRHVPGLNVANH